MISTRQFAAGVAFILAVASAAAAEDGPYLRFTEENGHLVFASVLKSGKTDIDMLDAQGQQLKGFVFVDREQNDRRVRLFRLISSGLAKGLDKEGLDKEGNLEASYTEGEFSVVYHGTPNPDHYVVLLTAMISDDGRVYREQARIEHNCCGYFVSATQRGAALETCRAPQLSQIMAEASDTYRQFERLAQACNRPGFQFVPVRTVSGN